LNKSIQHLQSIGVHDLWETPPDIFKEFCNKVKIYPEIDVCATSKTTKCFKWYGPDHPNPEHRNGFDHLWNKPFFMNPPYSNKEEWLEYAINQSIAWGVPCIILIYAKTDTRWWQRYVTENDFVKVYFHRGRIRFWKDGKPGPSAAPYGSAWLVINP